MKRHHFCSVLLTTVAMAMPLSLSAQDRAADASPEGLDAREVHALLARTLANQADIQRISLELALHQSRQLQLSAQLEAIRTDMAGSAAYVAALRRLMADVEAEENAGTPEGRREAAGLRTMFEPQLAAAREQDREIRAREQSLVAQLEAEEAGWSDAAARLTQLTAR